MPVAGGPFIQKTGILLEVDAANAASYPGTGTTWANLFRPGTYNGTITGSVTYNSTDAYGALQFPANNSYVDFGNVGDLSVSWSFQVAVKPAPSASGNYTILSYTSGSGTGSLTFKLDYSSSNQVATLSSYSVTGSTQIVHRVTGSVSTGSWSIINASYGATVIGMFVNGRPTDYAVTTGSTVGYSSNNKLVAGGTNLVTSSYYSGSLASLLVYNADVANTRIIQNYNAFATRFGLPPSNLFVYATDPDAFRFIEVANITSSVEVAAVNTLVVSLKSANLWTRMRAIYPAVGITAFSQKYNLINPTQYNLAFAGGWTYSGTGMLPNGTNAVAIPDINTSAMGNDFGIGVYLRTNPSTAGEQAAIGFKDGASFTSAPVYTFNGTSKKWWLSYNLYSESTTEGRGLHQFQYRTDGSAVGYYQDTQITSTTFSFSSRIAVGFANGLFGSSWSNQEISFAFLSFGLSNTEIVTFNTIVQNYLNSLSRKAL
jgi:hypothetical protein